MAAVGWQVLVSGWGRPINLQFPGWSFAATPFVSGISQSSLLCHVTLEEGLVTYVCVSWFLVSASVQTFYAWRIWRLGRWRVVPLAIIIVSRVAIHAITHH